MITILTIVAPDSGWLFALNCSLEWAEVLLCVVSKGREAALVLNVNLGLDETVRPAPPQMIEDTRVLLVHPNPTYCELF